MIFPFPDSIKKKIKKRLFGAEQFDIHFAQVADDVIFRGIWNSFFKACDTGFFIDVGSFHPYIGSNTFMLYKNGWSGINIDPRPGSKALFDKVRPRDINLEIGIGAREETMKYYFIGDDSALNSFSKDALIEMGVFDQVRKVVDCPVLPLDQVIRKHVPESTGIHFLNVDAEGFEMEVLTSIDWSFKRPQVIALEQNKVTGMHEILASESCGFLESNSYMAVASNMVTRTIATVFYVDKTRIL